MSVCCCSMAGTAACQHCRNNPMATDVWSNTIMLNHVETKSFGNGLDVYPVCGKPSTIGKPLTNADRIRAMTDEELSYLLGWPCVASPPWCSINTKCPYMQSEDVPPCDKCAFDWLKQEVDDE